MNGTRATRSRAAGGHGDLLAKIEVEIPQKLTKAEKDALEAFAREHDANPRAHLDEALKQRAGARRAS